MSISGAGRRMSQCTMSFTDTVKNNCDSIRPLAGAEEEYEAWDREAQIQRSSLPIWEGRLKQRKSQMFGLCSDVWRDRWVRLDPKAGLLHIWDIRDKEKASSSFTGPAKKKFELGCIRGIDSNRHHLDIMILFSDSMEKEKVKYALHLRATTVEDYKNWMFVLGHFGMRHDLLGVDAKLRGQLTRAFSTMKLDTACMKIDSVHDDDVFEESFTDDDASQHSTPVSESTNCSVQTIDDDALRILCVALEDASPYNEEWRKKAGLTNQMYSCL